MLKAKVSVFLFKLIILRKKINTHISICLSLCAHDGSVSLIEFLDLSFSISDFSLFWVTRTPVYRNVKELV